MNSSYSTFTIHIRSTPAHGGEGEQNFHNFQTAWKIKIFKYFALPYIVKFQITLYIILAQLYTKLQKNVSEYFF